MGWRLSWTGVVRVWASITALVFLAGSTGSVRAATVVQFDPARGSPGTPIVGSTIGAGMSGFEDAQVPILLAPTQRIADHAMDPSDPRLSAFGRMSADAGDIGHFIGTVPNIEPGNYVAVAYCRECIPGGSMFTVGEFRVEGSPLPRTGRRSSVWLLLGMLLVVLGSAAVVGNMAPRGTPATPDSSYSRLIKAKTRETNEARVGDDPVVGGGDDRMQRQ